MTARSRTLLLALLAALALPALLAPAGAAAARRAPARCTQRAARGRRARRRAGCTPRTRRGQTERGPWLNLQGQRYEFDTLQISGQMTAQEFPESDFGFRGSSTVRIAPKTRVERGLFDQTRTEVGGRFTFEEPILLAIAEPVQWSIDSSATYYDSDGEPTDCTWNAPAGIDKLGGQMWWDEDRNRVAVRWHLYTGGWGCRGEVTTPSCGNETGGDASMMFYKEIEFTRRWIKLPIDLQWRTEDDVACEFRWNGSVRLKKLNPGER